jgi:prephenate dehydrogenase
MGWEKVTLIGAGLLGGSLGMAIRRHKLAREVCAYVRRAATIPQCQKLGVADSVTLDLTKAAQGADFVIFCTPLAQMRPLAEKIAPRLKPGVLVTDVGSVKASVQHELSPLIAQAQGEFIGSHPMAGSEQSGVAAARADLFEGSLCVITPGSGSSPKAIAALQHFWKGLGSAPVRMSPQLHDDLVSRSSHLPQVVAAELANYVLSPAHPKQQSLLCAGGFRDTTRIASGSPEMWRDIALANRKNLARVLGVFIENLQEFQLALEREDVKAIEEFFTKAKQRRDDWCAQRSAAATE